MTKKQRQKLNPELTDKEKEILTSALEKVTNSIFARHPKHDIELKYLLFNVLKGHIDWDISVMYSRATSPVYAHAKIVKKAKVQA